MYLLLFFIISLIICTIGFKKYVWFISLGYGFSIAALGLTMIILFFKSMNLVTILLSLLLIVYGLRLGIYLLLREIKSASYNQKMKKEIKDGDSVKLSAKVMIWLSAALLYVCEISPVYFRIINGYTPDLCAYAGLIIMAAGIILESHSDYTKNEFKKIHPDRFCDVKIFKLVRCPNYLGEVITWTGVFISAVTILEGIQWIPAIIGWVCIIYIMFGGARRLELRQNRNYGNNPEYQEYVKTVPIILPFVPLYSVAKYKWLVG